MPGPCARASSSLANPVFAVASEAAPSDGAIEAAAVPAPPKDRPLLDSSRLVSNADLSDMRGGFFVAGGAQFDFGASIRTLVNGQLALQTNLSWTPAGSVVQQLAGLGTSIQAEVAGDLAKAGIGAPVSGPSVPSGAAQRRQYPAGRSPIGQYRRRHLCRQYRAHHPQHGAGRSAP